MWLLVALALLTAVLVAPMALRREQIFGDLWIAWVWTDQFAAALAAGDLYPRWLPRSHGGLGSPVFFFYPPLAFYVTALFRGLGLTTQDSLFALVATSYFLSGLAMYRFLRAIRATRPELGALMYMALPYHLVDYFVRGALAEHVAFVWIPLVALGLVRSRTTGNVLVLALSLGGLILTHLPVAMLVCVFMIGPALAEAALRATQRLAAMLFAVATGIALSAIFLVPALAFERFRDVAALWTRPGLKPAAWSVWNIGNFGPEPGLHFIVLLVCAAMAVPALLLAERRTAGYCAFALACLAMGVALVPAIWQIPLLAKAQFAFRIVPLAEFALCAALACSGRSLVRVVPLFAPALALSAVLLGAASPKPPKDITMELLRTRYPDVPENLPPAGPRRLSWPSFWALDLATRPPVATIPGWTAAPIFYFPIWTADCRSGPGEVRSDPRTGLLLYRGDGCRLRRIDTWPERVGRWLSLLGALALAGWAIARHRTAARIAVPAGGRHAVDAG